MENKKLRLIVTYKCNKQCAGCCNKNLPVKPIKIQIEDLHKYDEIYFTGGEPSIFLDRLYRLIIKANIVINKKYLYIADFENIDGIIKILSIIDGITCTLHDEKDLSNFLLLDYAIKYSDKSLWLNVFKNIPIEKYTLNNNWNIRAKKWGFKAMPQNEILGELDSLW